MLYEVPYEVFFLCDRNIYDLVKDSVCYFPGYINEPNQGADVEKIRKHLEITIGRPFRRPAEFIFIYFKDSNAFSKKTQKEINRIKELITKIKSLYKQVAIFPPAIIVWGERNDIIKATFKKNGIDYVTTSELLDKSKVKKIVLDVYGKLYDYRKHLAEDQS